MRAVLRKKIFFVLLFIAMAAGFFALFGNSVFAAAPDLGLSYGAEIGLTGTDIRIVVARIIKVALGLLGIVAVVLVIYAGFLWMTAGGDDERVGRAKKILINAVIGLAIILSAYAIVSFVMDKLLEATQGLPAHCSNGRIDISDGENGVDCDGECPACDGGENPYLPGGNTLYIMTMPAAGQQCVRDFHPMIVFNRNVASSTVPSNIIVENSTSSAAAAGVWQYGERENIMVFVPSGECGQMNPRNNCLPASATYTLRFANLSAVRSKPATQGGSTVPLVGCRDPQNQIISSSACDGVEFAPGEKMDMGPPGIAFLQPITGAQLQRGAAVPVNYMVNDDSGVQNAVLYEGRNLVDSRSFAGCQTAVTVDTVWPTDLLNGGLYTLSVLGSDWSAHTTSSSKSVRLRAEHCFNGIRDQDETEQDCGGADCGVCDNLFVNSLPAGGQLCVRNARPTLVFSKNVAIETINGNAVFEYNGGQMVDGSWGYNGPESMAIFTPVGSCAPSPGNDCFPASATYTLRFLNLGAIKSKPNNQGERQLSLIGCKDAATRIISREACDGAEFRPGDKIDLAPPAVLITAPSADVPLQLGAVIPIRVAYQDDRGMQTVALYEENRLIASKSFNGCQTEGLAELIWPTTGLDVGAHTIDALGVDWAARQGRDARVFRLNKEHCSSNTKDADETDIDCGGEDCSQCTGGPCVINSDCASGVCRDGHCLAFPRIERISPQSGAVGTYVSVLGYDFGTERGNVYFSRVADPRRNSDEDWVLAESVICGGSDGWSPWQTIVKAPAGTVAGPIKIVTADGRVDVSNDNWGRILPFFQVTNERRPGLCAIIPARGIPETDAELVGDGFGAAVDDAEDKVMFGNSKASVKAGNWAENVVTAIVPQLAAGGVGVSIFNNGIESNSLFFEVLTGIDRDAPFIDSITPNSGARGEYIVITGRNFGNVRGKVRFLLTSQSPAILGDAAFPVDCAPTDVWTDNKIIIKFPKAPAGEAGRQYLVQVVNVEGGTEKLSPIDPNIVFSLTNGLPKPGVCSITPRSAPLPYPIVQAELMIITGEYFVNDVNNAGELDNLRIYFATDASVSNSLVNRAEAVKADFGVEQIGIGQKISGFYPPKSWGGRDVISGDVFVARFDDVGGAAISDPLRFDVMDCRPPFQQKPANKCTEDILKCCPSNGICVNGTVLCANETRSTGYVWRFSTQTIPPAPRVVVRCEDYVAGRPYALPTPSPRLEDPYGGNVCVTALGVVEFSLPMDAAIFARESNNIVVNSCESVQDNNCVNPAPVQLTDDSYVLKSASTESQSATEYIQFQPAVRRWGQNVWYQVVLKNGLRSAGADSLPLLSTRPCDVANSAYCYVFKTGSEICRMSGVVITPYKYWTDILESIIIRDRTAVPVKNLEYLAGGISNQTCVMMDVTGFDWSWWVAPGGYSNVVSPVDNKTNASAEANTVGINLDDPVDAVNIVATARTSTPQGDDLIFTGFSPLTIDLNHPKVLSRWPDCQEACTNAEIGVKFNTAMSNFQKSQAGVLSPINIDSVRLRRCTDENCHGWETINDIVSSFEADKMTLNITHADLAPNQIYMVAISAPSTTPDNIPQLGSVVQVDGNPVFGSPLDEEYSWRFRTKNVPCVINRVEVSPAVYYAMFVNDKNIYKAQPFSSPDGCSAQGQKLDPRSVGWNWQSGDENVATVQSFATVGRNENCTPTCIRKGSDIPAAADSNVIIPICGNNRVEAGEDCEPPNLTPPDGNCGLDCLNKNNRRAGSVAVAAGFASVCGNGLRGDNEDCDLGIAAAPANRESAWGCSERCLHLGSRISNLWCQEHLRDFGDLGFIEKDFKDACARSYSQCGNDIVEPDEDPACDTGTGVSDSCNEYCLLKVGDTAADIKVDGNISNDCRVAGASYTVGCNPVAHQHIGSNLLFNTPSVCGDGQVGYGEDAYCELPAFFTTAAAIFSEQYNHVPWALATGVGNGNVVDQNIIPSAQRAFITASAGPDGTRSGRGEFRVNCGYERDSQCRDNEDNSEGVGSDSCCYARPRLTNTIPIDGFPNTCPNAMIEADFFGVIDKNTLANNVIIARSVVGACPGGEAADVTNLINVAKANNSDYPLWYKKIFVKVIHFIKGFFVEDAVAQEGGAVRFCAGDDTGIAEVSMSTETTSKIRIKLLKPLRLDSNYVVILREGIRDIKGVSVGMSANGSRIHWNFHTLRELGEMCRVESVSIEPSAYGFSRANTSASFAVHTAAVGGQEIQPIPAFYDWNYLWGPQNNGIVAIAETTAIAPTNILTAQNRNGEVDIRAAVNVTADVYGGARGVVASGLTHILVSLCENNWPPIDLYIDTNNDGQTEGPFLSAPYADKDGNVNGFDLNRNIFNYTPIPRADIGGYFNFSTHYCADSGSYGVDDDLPYLRPAVQTSAAMFNLSGICDNDNTKVCTVDANCTVDDVRHICRKNNPLKRFIFTNTTTPDAIGITIFSNPLHLTAREWYARDKARGGQGFAGDVRNITIDKYDAVTDGNNIYVDALNVALSQPGQAVERKIYNNIYLISINADARPNTRKVFDEFVKNFKFNINLDNNATCACPKKCSDSGTVCDADNDCKNPRMPYPLNADGSDFQGMDRFTAVCAEHITNNQECAEHRDCAAEFPVCDPDLNKCYNYVFRDGGPYTAGHCVAGEGTTMSWGYVSAIKAAQAQRSANNNCVPTCAPGETACQNDLDCPVGGYCQNTVDKLKNNYTRLRDIGDIEQVLGRYAYTHDDTYPDLQAGTFLSGQAISTWPSWRGAFSTAVQSGLPEDPINRLDNRIGSAAGTCKEGPNRARPIIKYCLSEADCQNFAPTTTCLMHDPATGWSDADRRFSFACSPASYAYRYIVHPENFELRAKFERPFLVDNNTAIAGDGPNTPNSWSGFVSSFIENVGNRNIFRLDDDNGICSQVDEVVSLQQGRCGDGKINIIEGSDPPRMEECDPMGIERFGECINNRKTVEVCGQINNEKCRWTASTTAFADHTVLCSYTSHCGNGIVEAGEVCDEGQALNSRNTVGHCNSTCSEIVESTCGNGVVDAGELCDWYKDFNLFELFSVGLPTGSCAHDDSPCAANIDCRTLGECSNDNDIDCQADSDCPSHGICAGTNTDCAADADCPSNIIIPPQSGAFLLTNVGVVRTPPNRCKSCADFGLDGNGTVSNGSVSCSIDFVAGGRCVPNGQLYNCVIRTSRQAPILGAVNLQNEITLNGVRCDKIGNTVVCSSTGNFRGSNCRLDYTLRFNIPSLTPSAVSCVANSCINRPAPNCVIPPSPFYILEQYRPDVINIDKRVRYSSARRENTCNWDCKSYGPYCGDGIIQGEFGEECDGSESCSVNQRDGTRHCSSDCRQLSPAVSWWRFNSTTRLGVSVDIGKDFSPVNARDAIDCGFHCPRRVIGRAGSAAAFDGVNDYLEVPHNDSLMAPRFSVEAWIKPDASNPHPYARIVDKVAYDRFGSGLGGYDLEFSLVRQAPDPIPSAPTAIRFNVWGLTTGNINATAYGADSSNITLDEWHHVVGTFDGTIARVYVDGSATGTLARGTMSVNTSPMFIGTKMHVDSGRRIFDRQFIGSIDEVSYYDRVLSESEIKDHFENQKGWFCSTTPAAGAAANKAVKCGDGIVDPGEACDNGARNGVVCTPAYGQHCTYCSFDCNNIITKEPEKQCGDGIIQGAEVCEFLPENLLHIWVTSTFPALIRPANSDTNDNINDSILNRSNIPEPAHNGYLALTCEQEFNTRVNTLVADWWGECARDVNPVNCDKVITHKKGNKTCADNCMTLSSGCVECGIDMERGVEVSGSIINVIDPVANQPLYSHDQFNSAGGTGKDVNMMDMYYIGNNGAVDTNDIVSMDKNRAAFYHREETDFKNFTLKTRPVPPASERIPAKINPNELCFATSTASTGERYQMIINNDFTHPWDWPVYSRPQQGQYDMVLSPVINSADQNQQNHIRVVVRWKGDATLYGGFFNPTADIFGQGINRIDGQNTVTTTGLDYYTTRDKPDYGVWYHGFGFTKNNINAESFTINTSPGNNSGADKGPYMPGGSFTPYAFYVYADSIQSYRNTGDVRVEVYLPENDPISIHFAKPNPDYTFVLTGAKPSNNREASYWHVFNIVNLINVIGFPRQTMEQKIFPVKDTYFNQDNIMVSSTERYGMVVTGLDKISL